MIVDGVKVTSLGLLNFTEQEAKKYIKYVYDNVKIDNCGILDEIIVTGCSDGKVDLSYKFIGEKFERIRRVTGYLTGDVTSWNDAKQSEERERVKHIVKNYN